MVACMAFTLPSSSSTYCFFLCRDRCALSRLRTSRARRFASSSSPFPLPLPSVPLALLEDDSEDSSFLSPPPSLPAPEEDDPRSGDPAEEDEVASGGEAREMPCEHRFHDQCILPWLEMHSSCPVCRHQLPTEEPAAEAIGSGRGAGVESGGNARGGDGGSGGGRRHWFSWPFGGLFSQRSNGNSSSSSS